MLNMISLCIFERFVGTLRAVGFHCTSRARCYGRILFIRRIAPKNVPVLAVLQHGSERGYCTPLNALRQLGLGKLSHLSRAVVLGKHGVVGATGRHPVKGSIAIDEGNGASLSDWIL